MKIQRINRDDADHADVAVVNAAGATITLGLGACFTTTANSNDGVKAVLSASPNNIRTFAGIALQSIPNTEAGVVRAYGFVNSVAIFATGTSGTVIAGDPLGPGVAASAGQLNSTGLTYAFGPVIAMEQIGAAIQSPGGYAKGWVRAL